MLLTALGLITVTVAGTPVPVTTVTTLRANKLLVWPKAANAGLVTIKDAAGHIVCELLAPKATTGIGEKFVISAGSSENALQLSQYLLDAASNGDGAYISYWTT